MNQTVRILSKCGNSRRQQGREEFHFSQGAFIRQLLLFDELIIQSVRLREFGPLIDLFGFDAVMALLESGAVRLHCNALIIGEIGRTEGLLSRKGKPPLPLNHYSFASIGVPNRNEYLMGCLPSIYNITTITAGQRDSLLEKVLNLVEDPVESLGVDMLNQTMTDFRGNIPTIKLAVSTQLKFSRELAITPSQFNISIEEIAPNEFRTESDLASISGVSPEEEHSIIQGALLAVGRLNQRIAEMKVFDALAPLSVEDVPLFDDKLSFLVRRLDSSVVEGNFTKVLETLSLPDLEEAAVRQTVDLHCVLEVRESEECQQFRQWLSSARDVSSQDLTKLSLDLRTKIGEVISTPVGRVSRFLVAGGIGLACAPIGLALGVLDQFLLKKLFPQNRIAGFLHRLYPSVFETNTKN